MINSLKNLNVNPLRMGRDVLNGSCWNSSLVSDSSGNSRVILASLRMFEAIASTFV